MRNLFTIIVLLASATLWVVPTTVRAHELAEVSAEDLVQDFTLFPSDSMVHYGGRPVRVTGSAEELFYVGPVSTIRLATNGQISGVTLYHVPAKEFSQLHRGSEISIPCTYMSYQHGMVYLTCNEHPSYVTSSSSGRHRKYRHRVKRMNKLSRSALSR